MEPPETIIVSTKTVSCDGGGALGHPKVYLTVGEKGEVDCPYCDRRFVIREDAADSAAE